MSSVVAIVKSIVGQVVAVSPEGIRRVLIEGDRLLAGEQVLTGPAGAVTLELPDGRQLDIGRDSQWSSDAPTSTTNLSEATAQAAPSVAELQQAIAAGADPTKDLEATAAGQAATGTDGGNAGGGHSVVMLTETAGSVTPTIGFNTAGLTANALPPVPLDGALLNANNNNTNVNAPQTAATLSLSATSTLTEAGGALVFTATVTQAPQTNLTVTLSNGSTILIQAGQTTGTVTVNVPDGNTPYIDPRTISTTITGTSGGTDLLLTTDTTPAVTTITDTIDTTVASITGSTQVTEGEAATYTISLSNPAQTEVTINLTYSGTAADGSDYTQVVSVKIPANSSSVTFNLQTVNDTIPEGVENVTVAIGAISGGNFENVVASSTNGSVTTTIIDNDALPVVDVNGGGNGTNGEATFTEGQSGVAIAGQLTVGDVDSPTLQSAKVTLTNAQPLDTLVVASPNANITVTTATVNGQIVLTLTGTATPAEYEAVIKSITFANSSEDPNTVDRNIIVTVNDGQNDSVPVTSTVHVIAVNDAPVAAIDGNVSFTEGQDGVSLAGKVTLTDVDNDNLQSGKVTLVGTQDGDTLTIGSTNTSLALNQTMVSGNITVTETKVDGNIVLTLTGNASKAEYQALIDSVTFGNSSQNPTTEPREITVSVNDGALDSNLASTSVTVIPVNDAPTVDSTISNGLEDGILTVVLNGGDVDGTIDHFNLVSMSEHGKFYSDAAGTQELTTLSDIAASGNTATIYFKPTGDWSGDTGFTYQAVDDKGLVSAAPANGILNVAPVTDTPDLSMDTDGFVRTINFEGNTTATGDFKSIPVSEFSGGVWKTDDSGGTVEIGHAGVYGVNDKNPNNQVIELERDAGDPANLYTDFAVKSGETYTISVDYSPRANALDNSVINVFWGTTLIGTLNDTATGFHTYTFQVPVTADGTAHLEFKAADSNSYGGLLDNISVVQNLNTGLEDQPILLAAVKAATTDVDGSETLLLTLSKLPQGSLITDGNPAHSFTAGTNNASVDITSWNLSTLKFTAPQNYSGDVALTLTATAKDGAADPVSKTLDFDVHVVAVADAPNLAGTTAIGDEDTAIPLTIATPTLTDTDGSESLSVSVSGIPLGAVLTDGSHSYTSIPGGDGTVVIDGWNMNNITITPPKDFNGQINLAVNATSTEASNGDFKTTTQPLPVTVTPVNDAPVANATSGNGTEDNTLSIVLSGRDVDGPVDHFNLVNMAEHGKFYSDAAGTQELTNVSDIKATDNTATIFFKPTGDWSGDTSFTYQAVDNLGLASTNTANGTITVAPVTDTPALSMDTDGFVRTINFEGNTTATGDFKSIPVTEFSGGVWKTDDSGGTVEIGHAGVYGVNDTNPNNQVIELERDAGDPANLYTDFAVKSGETYTVSVDYSPRANAMDNSVINVFWGTTLIGTLNANATGLQTYTFQVPVTADGNAHLEFKAADSNSYGGLLDNISVVQNLNTGLEDQPILLAAVKAATTDVDGSETLSVTLGKLPQGSLITDGNPAHSFTAGTDNASVDITGWNLSALKFTAPQNYSGDVALTLTATAKDGAADAVSKTLDFEVHVVAVADAPNLAVTTAVGDEDTAIQLSITPALVDTDGSETLSTSIGGIPKGAVLTDGTPGHSFTAGADNSQTSVDGWNMSTLTLTPPKDANGQINLTVTTTSTESSNNSQASTTQNLLVNVTPVNDAPTIAVVANDLNEGKATTSTVAASFTTQDIDSTNLTVSLTPGSDDKGFYVVNGNDVLLTAAGVAEVNSGKTLPQIDLTVSDGQLTGTASATPNVLMNAAPEAQATSGSGLEDASQIAVTLHGTDTDGSVKSFVVNTLPANGTLYSDSAMTKPVTAGSSVAVGADGNANVYFKPTQDWSGDTSFSYNAVDDLGKVSANTSNGSITVAPVTDTPSLSLIADRSVVTLEVDGTSTGNIETLTNNVWHTDNNGENVEINTPGTYGAGSNANSNDRVLELERDAGDPANLYTNITAKDGATYTITLDYSPREGALDNSTINVTWGGVLIGTLSANATGMNSYTFQVPVTADGAAKLEFKATDSNSFGGVVDNIKVVETLNTGLENHPILLSTIQAATTDTDGSETLALTLNGLPKGSVVTDGTAAHTANIGADNSSVDISGWNLSTLKFTPPTDATGDIALSVTATAKDGAADAVSTSLPLVVHVIAVNDAPFVAGSDMQYTESSAPIAIVSGLNIGDTDSNTLSKAVVTLTNLQSSDTLDSAMMRSGNTSGISVVKSGSEASGTVVYTMSGNASAQAYNDLISSITFKTGVAPSTTSRGVDIQVTDAGGTGQTALASTVMHSDIAVTAVTNLVLSAASTSVEGSPITYSIALKDNAGNLINAKTDMVVTLDDNTKVTIAAGTSSKTVEIAGPADDAYVGQNDVTHSIKSATDGGLNALVVDTSGIVTRISDTIDVTKISITGASTVAEGGTASYNLHLSNPSHAEVTVTLNYSGTATNGTDFQGQTTVTIPANSSDHAFTIKALTDNLVEGAETFTVTLANPAGGNYEGIAVDSTQASVTTVVTDTTMPTAGGNTAVGFEDQTLVFNWSNFGATNAASSTVDMAVKITSIPPTTSGSLQYLDNGTWKAVAMDQVISKSVIDAGGLKFTPVADASGDNSFGGNGVGNKQADYAQLGFQPVAGGLTGAASLVKIDITPVADQPQLSLGTSAVTSTGLVKDVWVGTLKGLDYSSGNGSGATESMIKAGFNTTTAATTHGFTNTATQASATPTASDYTIAAGTGTKLSGLMYLEAGHTYKFFGNGDDSLLVTLGGTTVANAAYGTNSGAISSTGYTPAASGFYTLDIYHYNQNGPGNYTINLADQTNATSTTAASTVSVALNSSTALLYTSVDDLKASGLSVSALNETKAGSGEGYYAGYPLNHGTENAAIKLSSITAAYTDNDGSETHITTISGAPAGSVLTDGAGHSVTVVNATTPVDVSALDLTTLSVKTAEYYSGKFTLTVTATATETSNMVVKTDAVQIPVTVEAGTYKSTDGGAGDNTITGTTSNDIVVGDVSAVNLVAGQNYNLAFMVDTSGSMQGSLTQIVDQLQSTFKSLQNAAATSSAGTVKVYLVDFDSTTHQSVSVDLSSSTALSDLNKVLASMTIGGNTNYEAVFNNTTSWFTSAAATSNTNAQNLTYFITDGEPNRYVTSTNGSASGTAATVSSESVAAFNNLVNSGHTAVEAIGLNSGVSSAALDKYDSNSHSQTNIDPSKLTAAILSSETLVGPGNDSLSGGDGNDILFGDLINYGTQQGTSALKAFAADTLHVDVSTITDSSLHQFVSTHLDAVNTLANSSNTTGLVDGNDTLLGGNGDDILFGQGGNDILVGGKGNDIMFGGAGADTFTWKAGDTNSGGFDVIKDFSTKQGDKLDLSDLLQNEDGSDATALAKFLQITNDGKDTTVQVSTTGQFTTNPTPAAAANTADVHIKLENVTWNNDMLKSLVQGADPTIKVDHH